VTYFRMPLKQVQVLLLLLLPPVLGFAAVTGSVLQSSTGVGIADVAVSNGRDIATTDINGRYALPEYGEFVYLARSDQVDPAEWYKPRDSETIDFNIPSSVASTGSTFFIQISDTHVYDRKSDFLEFSSPSIPWFIPSFLVPWITVSLLEKSYGDDVIDKLRHALMSSGYEGDLGRLSDTEVYTLYADIQSSEQSIFKPLSSQINEALKEVAGLNPNFIINTGDLVLESNNGSADAIDRWFKYYHQLTKDLPVRIYNTIGNNEIAGTEREQFASSDPRFGKFFFKSYLGPTHFSFDRNGFHFVAIDTHSSDPQEDNPDYWNFGKMTPDIQQWFENDLEANKAKTIVVLNHEPFHFDELWPFEGDQHVDDGGLFAKFGVDYVLTGHTHYKSAMKIGGVEHLTAGALSGMRWILPATVHERGYRLFQSVGSELYSAWKETGKPFIGLTEPQPKDTSLMVVAVVDAAGAFESVQFFKDDKPIPSIKLSDYFYQLAAVDLNAGDLRAVVKTASGRMLNVGIGWDLQ
jgi:predicted MPP superfamily phosphohydrolase